MTSSATPERWARLIDDRSPGLTWLAATLLQWSALLAAERRSWRVTATAVRGGKIQALAALHEDTGVLALVAEPEAPTPFFGLPDAVRRVMGDPEVVLRALDAVPELEARRTLSVRRSVHVATESAEAADAEVRRARDEEVNGIEHLLFEGGADPDPMDPVDLTSVVNRGDLWVLTSGPAVVGSFRVAGHSLRHVQIEDLVVKAALRGQGLDTRLARAAAHVARREYAGTAVAAVPESEAARRAFASAGWAQTGTLEDVRFR